MNYRFHDAAIGFFAPNGDVSTTQFDTALASIREDYPPNAIASSMNLIDSHDTARALTEMGGDKSRLRMLALLQFTSAGAPTVYYGDEAGLAGGKDPDDRRTYPWGGEDTSLIAYYQTLAAARHRVSALRTGDTVTLLAQDSPRVYAYARHDAAGTAVVAFNLDSAPQPLSLDVHALLADGAALHDLLSNGTTATVQAGHLQVTVPPGGEVLLLP